MRPIIGQIRRLLELEVELGGAALLIVIVSLF